MYPSTPSFHTGSGVSPAELGPPLLLPLKPCSQPVRWDLGLEHPLPPGSGHVLTLAASVRHVFVLTSPGWCED